MISGSIPSDFSFHQQGWECPKCHAVMASWYPTCFYCKPVQTQTVSFSSSPLNPAHNIGHGCISTSGFASSGEGFGHSGTGKISFT
jgi:hypothetical protein